MPTPNTARWINRNSRDVHNEMYRPDRRYDVVVFVKAMDERARREAARVREYGARVVFDANVNYYEVWGDYEIPGTMPTPEQQRAAVEMTRLADWVVADSSYLLGIVEKLNASASWIPDNVDLAVFRGIREHRRRSPLRIVWSGMAEKGLPLVDVAAALRALPDAELVLVSNEPPGALKALASVARCTYVPFSLRGYARALRGCDVVISPKRLVNGYELGHTEWKITPGMAVGLPAVASPQQAYVEAIEAGGGGIVAGSIEEWEQALTELAGDPERRAELGGRARETVLTHYSTPVVAGRYLELLRSLA
jgi:glycosyltransferase involved in cell wall biosynthesis